MLGLRFNALKGYSLHACGMLRTAMQEWKTAATKQTGEHNRKEWNKNKIE